MNSYYWTHLEYELRSPYAWGYTAFDQWVRVTNRNLGINYVHRIGAGNLYYDISAFSSWDYFAENIYEV